MVLKKNVVETFPFRIQIEGSQIEQVSNFKFLGMTLDGSVTWQKHCELLLTKLKQLNFLINRIKELVQTGCLRNLYFGHFHSHLAYGIRLWGNSIGVVLKESIFKQQKRSVRILTRSGYCAHIDPLFKRVGILKLSEV